MRTAPLRSARNNFSHLTTKVKNFSTSTFPNQRSNPRFIHSKEPDSPNRVMNARRDGAARLNVRDSAAHSNAQAAQGGRPGAPTPRTTFRTPRIQSYSGASSVQKQRRRPQRITPETRPPRTFRRENSILANLAHDRSNAKYSAVDALKYGSGVELLQLCVGPGHRKISLFREMEQAALNNQVEDAFALYGQYCAEFPNEPKSTYMGNMLLRLSMGQHISRVSYLLNEHFEPMVWRDIHATQKDGSLDQNLLLGARKPASHSIDLSPFPNPNHDHMKAPQNLETFRLAIVALGSTGNSNTMIKYFKKNVHFFGPDIVAYHSFLRQLMTVPNERFLKWFKKLFSTSMAVHIGKKNYIRIQPTLDTWKMLMIYLGGLGRVNDVYRVYQHLKAIHTFKYGWQNIEQELTYTFNKAVLQAQVAKGDFEHYQNLLADSYNSINFEDLPRFPTNAYDCILYPRFDLDEQLLDRIPHPKNDLTKLDADDHMIFNARFHFDRVNARRDVEKMIKTFRDDVYWDRQSNQQAHATYYANRILSVLTKKNLSLGFLFLLENYELRNPQHLRAAMRKVLQDRENVKFLPGRKSPKNMLRLARLKAYLKYEKSLLNNPTTKLSLFPVGEFRKELVDRGVQFAKIQPNEATFATLFHQAARYYTPYTDVLNDEVVRTRMEENGNLLKKELELEKDETRRRELTNEYYRAMCPVAVEASPLAWSFLNELNPKSVEGAQHMTLGLYFRKYFGCVPIDGCWVQPLDMTKSDMQ